MVAVCYFPVWFGWNMVLVNGAAFKIWIRLLGNNAQRDKETIDRCAEKMTSGILEALALSTSQLQQSAFFSWWHVG